MPPEAVTRWDEPEAETDDSVAAEKLHSDSQFARVADSLRVLEAACWRSAAG